MILARRQFLGGLVSAFAAPAIVRASSLMPVKAMHLEKIIRYVPCGGGFSVYEDLIHITRQAFAPRLFVQRYDVSPITWALKNGLFTE